MVSRATRPAAASTPACRMPPPSILRHRLACLIFPAGPHSTLPTGQHSPLDRQNETVSVHSAMARDVRPGGHGGVEDPGAVQVHGQAVGVGGFGQLPQLRRDQATPPCQLCVFSIMTAADSGW